MGGVEEPSGEVGAAGPAAVAMAPSARSSPFVLALQGGAGSAILVTDIELVVLNGHESVAPFDLVTHFTVLRRAVHVSA